MTNSLGSTDEPVVHVGYTTYRDPMLELGVELYELSGVARQEEPPRHSCSAPRSAGCTPSWRWSTSKTIFVGSMNLDPRSATHQHRARRRDPQPELAREMIRIIDVDRLRSAYRLRLNKDGTACEWVSVDDDDEEIVLVDEPDSTFWLRLKTILLRPLVPESLL